jgi:hypothetical protein
VHLTRIRLVLIIVAIPVLMMSCGTLRLSLPIRGQLVDAVTGKPIPGGLVHLTAYTYGCLFSGWTGKRYLQNADSRSDTAGHFVVGGGMNILFPFCHGWENELEAVGLGYRVRLTEWEDLQQFSDSVGLGTPWPRPFFHPVRLELHQMHHRLEVLRLTQEYEHLIFGGPAFKEIARNWRARPAHPLTPLGVFEQRIGARFQQVVTFSGLGSETIFARDAISAQFVGWTEYGEAAPKPRGYMITVPAVPPELLSAGHAPREETLQCLPGDSDTIRRPATWAIMVSENGERGIFENPPTNDSARRVNAPPTAVAPDVIACTTYPNFRSLRGWTSAFQGVARKSWHYISCCSPAGTRSR